MGFLSMLFGTKPVSGAAPTPPPTSPTQSPPADPDTAAERLAAESLVEPFEGEVLHPYLDSAGVPTIGIGTTSYEDGRRVTMADPPISADRAVQLCILDLKKSDAALNASNTVPLTVHQRAALDDFIYNLGSGNFDGSTVRKDLEAGDYAGCAAHLTDWIMAGGKPSAGLLRRRQAEQAVFNTPDTPNG